MEPKEEERVDRRKQPLAQDVEHILLWGCQRVCHWKIVVANRIFRSADWDVSVAVVR